MWGVSLALPTHLYNIYESKRLHESIILSNKYNLLIFIDLLASIWYITLY